MPKPSSKAAPKPLTPAQRRRLARLPDLLALRWAGHLLDEGRRATRLSGPARCRLCLSLDAHARDILPMLTAGGSETAPGTFEGEGEGIGRFTYDLDTNQWSALGESGYGMLTLITADWDRSGPHETPPTEEEIALRILARLGRVTLELLAGVTTRRKGLAR